MTDPSIERMIAACQKYLVKCARCPDWFRSEELYDITGDEVVCGDCFDRACAEGQADSWDLQAKAAHERASYEYS